MLIIGEPSADRVTGNKGSARFEYEVQRTLAHPGQCGERLRAAVSF
jgi:hypothetical protein